MEAEDGCSPTFASIGPAERPWFAASEVFVSHGRSAVSKSAGDQQM
jgi:hypothetical protein